MVGHFLALTVKCNYANLPVTEVSLIFFLINVLSQINIYINTYINKPFPFFLPTKSVIC